ncbi:MAG: DUF2252 family protein [bacterium]
MSGISMKSSCRIFFAIELLTLLCINIFAGYATNTEESSPNPLYIDPATQDFSKNPKLLDRIRSGPHGYFRFINIPFSKEVCRRFNYLLVGAPSLNLHGDAHIEQYTVTDLGRGLTDFDDSSTGPGIIDLIRFGVSLRLACRAQGSEKHFDELYGEFLRGYCDALNDPTTMAPEPTLVKRIRSKFKSERESYFKWIDSIMEPVSMEERDSLWVAMQPYVETMLAESPDLTQDYFDVVKMGYLRMGIGSALDIKYLVRVRGKTSDAGDDVVLECKQVRDLSGIDCINFGQKINPFRILLGQARIAYQPFHHLGYFQFRGYIFWVHSWVENYQEVKIGKTFQSSAELAEVAYDIGVQLGRGHVKHIGAPLDLQIRRKQLQIVEKHGAELKQACRELFEQTVAAWEKFCEKL